MKPDANRELIRLFRAGDEGALYQIVREHYGLVLKCAEALCNTKQEANELVILVFIHSWKCRKRITLDRSLPTYYVKITHKIFTKKLSHDRHTR
jgi:hypothetical protein